MNYNFYTKHFTTYKTLVFSLLLLCASVSFGQDVDLKIPLPPVDSLVIDSLTADTLQSDTIITTVNIFTFFYTIT